MTKRGNLIPDQVMRQRTRRGDTLLLQRDVGHQRVADGEALDAVADKDSLQVGGGIGFVGGQNPQALTEGDRGLMGHPRQLTAAD